MVTHWNEVGLVRPIIAAAIAVLQAKGASKMEAYSAVAGKLGRSDRWVRAIVGRNHSTKISFSDWINIQLLCAKMQSLTDHLDAQSDALVRGDLRAAIFRHLPRDPFAPASGGTPDLPDGADAPAEGDVK